ERRFRAPAGGMARRRRRAGLPDRRRRRPWRGGAPPRRAHPFLRADDLAASARPHDAAGAALPRSADPRREPLPPGMSSDRRSPPMGRRFGNNGPFPGVPPFAPLIPAAVFP